MLQWLVISNSRIAYCVSRIAYRHASRITLFAICHPPFAIRHPLYAIRYQHLHRILNVYRKLNDLFILVADVSVCAVDESV